MLFVHLPMHSCILFHTENVARVNMMTEVEETEEEIQEEQLQEFEVADQVEEQDQEFNFANTESQQAKPWFIYPSALH